LTFVGGHIWKVIGLLTGAVLDLEAFEHPAFNELDDVVLDQLSVVIEDIVGDDDSG
jgi:hypothetical protein